jgi:hypothetical protein
MTSQELRDLGHLVRSQRWAALATLGASGPLSSMVAYAPEPDFEGLLMHLSALAPHTQNLLADPRASLCISAPDSLGSDPQALPRVSLQGRVDRVERASDLFAEARRRYLARLPTAEPLFELGDFAIFRLAPDKVRYVAGFGRALNVSPAQLRDAARCEHP